MSEVKPTAYIYEDHVFKTEKEAVLFKKEFDRYKHDGMLKHVILPLFTADEISDIYKQNKRVKMTQAEFDEFKLLYNLFNGSTVRGIINTVENNESKRFTNLKSRLNKTGKDLEIIILWSIYNPDEPEETIEIVPNMKWFVRSKESDINGYGWLSIIDKYQTPVYQYSHDKPLSMFVSFNTKEQAELWTNPLTEAVQLPVE